ncbi:MAG: hypothetical protein MUC40_08705 [Akkermansiaceae bacterium]|nr:hypothetical protein [Akkermansiaceae bacterium]
MNRTPLQHDDSWENDPVWKLLDQSPPATAGPRFADDAVRAARLAGQGSPWWSRVLAPLPLAGLAAAAAACVIRSRKSPRPRRCSPPWTTSTSSATWNS